MADFWILAFFLVALVDVLLAWFVLTRRSAGWKRLQRSTGAHLYRLLSLLSFRESRRLVRQPGNRLPAILIGIVYALASMLIGLMLEVFPTSQLSFFWQVIWYGHPSWDYPAILIAGPNEVIALPLLPTLTMVLVSAGVALGGGVALASLRNQLRNRRPGDGQRTAISSTAGLSSGITGLATLGACCCVSCATAGGVAVVAAASGASYYTLLQNNWYIDLFQIVVVGFSLLVQERNLRQPPVACPPPRTPRTYASAALRIGLLIAGITWSLAMFVEWSTVSPLTAGPALWYHWIFEHQLLALLAVGGAISPRGLADSVVRRASTVPGLVLRGALVSAAFTWGVWVPAPLTALGLGGLFNEIFGYVGLPASWGAIAPDSPFGPALAFHWIFQHALLATFGLAFAVWPSRIGAVLLWSSDGGPIANIDPTSAAAGHFVPADRHLDSTPALRNSTARAAPAAERDSATLDVGRATSPRGSDHD
jgi:hypothetical protein